MTGRPGIVKHWETVSTERYLSPDKSPLRHCSVYHEGPEHCTLFSRYSGRWRFQVDPSQVSGSATFEWLLVSFDNPRGEDGDGARCDLIGPCDHTFRFGLDWLGGSPQASETPILTKITGPFDNMDHNKFQSNADLNGVYNPITHNFNVWPGGILLKTHIEDDDTPFTAPDFVDDIIYRLEALPRPSEQSSIPTTASASGRRTTLTFTWRVYCDANFYGKDCTKLCQPHDDSMNGHYTCDNNGNKVCLAGWENVTRNCLTRQDDCLGNQCQNGAQCIDGLQSYTCNCRPGFTGKMCEVNLNECLPNPCQNEATCEDGINDYTCKCSPEFVGKNCSEKACVKSNPCQNGGTCYGDKNCFCPPNYVGQNCQDPLCKVVGCLNAGICSIDGLCVCKPGFVGSRCEVDLCTSIGKFCQNGGICKEGKCVCPRQFGGDACEENLLCSTLKCERGFCQVVPLKDGQTLVPQCQCPQGYTGERCELKQDLPIGGTIPYQSTQGSGSLPLFGILFIIFIILCVIFFIVIIVLSVLLCKKRKRNIKKPQLMSTSSILSSSSEIYSTVTESSLGSIDNSHKQPVSLNVYENSEKQNKELPPIDEKEFAKDDVFIPEEKSYFA